MFELLDEWQKLGGTFEELCNLCNISADYGRKQLEDCESENFNTYIAAYSLDYKNTGNFLENIPEAPFTVCIKEYMIDILVNTEEGRQAGHEVLTQYFPELFDKDGVEI